MVHRCFLSIYRGSRRPPDRQSLSGPPLNAARAAVEERTTPAGVGESPACREAWGSVVPRACACGSTLVLLVMLLSRAAFSDSGVVLESTGDVRLKLASGSVEPAHVGKKYGDGTTVITGANARAVVVTEFGQMFRIGPNTTVKIGERSGDSGTVSVSQGIMLALRESLGGPQAGPRAHGAVKGLGSNTAQSKMNKRSLERELKEADALPIESADAKAIIKGQIYYRYAEYRKAIALLGPVYHRQKNGLFLRELLVKAHENIGERFEAVH